MKKIIPILKIFWIHYIWRFFLLYPYNMVSERIQYINKFWMKKWLRVRKLLKNKNWIVSLKLENLIEKIYIRSWTSDYDVFNQIFLNKEYEYNIEFTPKVIIDCWANNWLSAVYFANKYPKAKIIAVEPENSNFQILNKNIKSYKNILPIKKWIWDKETNLVITNPTWTKWWFQVEESDLNEWLKATTINKIMDDYNIDFIDILKIDIEWSEKKVFENNSSNWLNKTKYIFVETHERYVKWCEQIIKEKAKEFWFKLDSKWENLILKK